MSLYWENNQHLNGSSSSHPGFTVLFLPLCLTFQCYMNILNRYNFTTSPTIIAMSLLSILFPTYRSCHVSGQSCVYICTILLKCPDSLVPFSQVFILMWLQALDETVCQKQLWDEWPIIILFVIRCINGQARSTCQCWWHGREAGEDRTT